MDTESTIENREDPLQSKKMPGPIDLVKNGWKLVITNLKLVGLLSVPFGLMEILRSVIQLNAVPENETLLSLVGIGSIVALGFYLLFFAVALYSVVHTATSEPSAAGFRWAKQHFWGLVWIGVLSGLVFMGGLILLIIPAIVMVVYISLGQIVLANEGIRGLAALARSRDLVTGNWRAVFWRLCGVQLILFISMVVTGVTIGVLTAVFVNELLSEFIINIVFTIFGAIGVLIMLSVTKEIYDALAHKKNTQASEEVSGNTVFITLICIGLLAPVLFVLLFGVMEDTLDSFAAEQQVVGAQSDLVLVQSQAAEYLMMQDESSYVGVCKSVATLLPTDVNTTCNDSDQEYAVSIQLENTTVCADSTGYNKVIYTALDDRTRCLDI